VMIRHLASIHNIITTAEESQAPRRTSLRRKELFDLGKKSLPFANESAMITSGGRDTQPGISREVMTMQVEKIKQTTKSPLYRGLFWHKVPISRGIGVLMAAPRL
jgi:hypothetical protein